MYNLFHATSKLVYMSVALYKRFEYKSASVWGNRGIALHDLLRRSTGADQRLIAFFVADKAPVDPATTPLGRIHNL